MKADSLPGRKGLARRRLSRSFRSYTEANPVDQYKASPQEWTCTRAEAMIACRHQKSTEQLMATACLAEE